MASRWHILLHPDFGLGSVTPLGQWVVGRSEVRRGSAYAHLVGLIHGKTVFLEEWGADHTLMGSHPSKEGEGAPEQTRTCPTSTLRAVMGDQESGGDLKSLGAAIIWKHFSSHAWWLMPVDLNWARGNYLWSLRVAWACSQCGGLRPSDSLHHSWGLQRLPSRETRREALRLCWMSRGCGQRQP